MSWFSWILGEKSDEEPEDRDRVSRERFDSLARKMAKAESYEGISLLSTVHRLLTQPCARDGGQQ